MDVFSQTKENKEKTRSALALLQNTLNAHKQNEIKHNQELNILRQKQDELQGLNSVKEEYSNLHDSIKEQEKLKEMVLKKEGLLKEQVQLREQYTKSKNKITQTKEEVKEYDDCLLQENELKKELNTFALQLKEYNEEEKNYHGIIVAQQSQIKELNEKITTIQNLGRDSNCPTCTRPLLEEYDNVLNTLNAHIQESQSNTIQKANESLQSVLKNKQNTEEQNTLLSNKHLEVSKKINLMENKKRDLQTENEHFKTISLKGLNNKKELEVLENYTYDYNQHEELLKRFNELKEKYEYVLALETMLKRVDIIKEELNKTLKHIEELSLKQENKEIEYSQINYNENEHKEKQKEFDAIQKEIESKVNQLNEIKVQIAALQGEIKTIQTTLDNNNKQLAKVQTKKDDLNDYNKIKISLSEFKTKLNSKIAPRISSFASDMYSRITNGKYQHIEVSNDFDFYIYDEGIKYPIERFSGGEIDLANLVLRIAISKTLRELSGASSIGFLAFDEVFGSQDEARRMEILEAFHTIKEQYRQIFLISHETEIKEMFERVIEL